MIREEKTEETLSIGRTRPGEPLGFPSHVGLNKGQKRKRSGGLINPAGHPIVPCMHMQ